MTNTKTVYCAIAADIDMGNNPPHSPFSLRDFNASSPEELNQKLADYIREDRDDEDLEAMLGITNDEETVEGNARLIEAYFYILDGDWGHPNLALRHYYRLTGNDTKETFEGLVRYEEVVDDTPGKLQEAIREKLDDLLLGGTLSKENKIIALQNCLNELKS